MKRGFRSGKQLFQSMFRHPAINDREKASFIRRQNDNSGRHDINELQLVSADIDNFVVAADLNRSNALDPFEIIKHFVNCRSVHFIPPVYVFKVLELII